MISADRFSKIERELDKKKTETRTHSGIIEYYILLKCDLLTIEKWNYVK